MTCSISYLLFLLWIYRTLNKVSYHVIMLICSPLHQGHHVTSHHIIITSHHHHIIIVIVVVIIITIIISWHTHHLCPLHSISTFMFAFFLLLYRCCLLLVFSPSFWASQLLIDIFIFHVVRAILFFHTKHLFHHSLNFIISFLCILLNIVVMWIAVHLCI